MKRPFREILIERYMLTNSKRQLAKMLLNQIDKNFELECIIRNLQRDNEELKEKIDKLKIYEKPEKEIDVPAFVMNRATDYIKFHR